MQSTCLACGHEANIVDGPPLEHSVIKCSECQARTAYGTLATRVVVEPSARNGHPMMRFRFQDPTTKEDMHAHDLDPQHAFLIAQAIISMVRP